ncbi:putative BAH domain-containing protein [Lupinus albus]|uniref:Putative BAH domain-containing protein n=1 Tax=Lupinus albus TaxID=3870 RepID=A0A6A4PYM9_LUPAL|nr:putative BAH domain-containing protein [Lupinus albus]
MMMMTGQWFYRPEEAPKQGGAFWKPIDTRELFYSFQTVSSIQGLLYKRCEG